MVVIEHNLDVIKCADWVIDIGPGAGIHGGHVVYEGTPEGLASTASGDVSVQGQHGDVVSVTAPFLAEMLGREVVARTQDESSSTASMVGPEINVVAKSAEPVPVVAPVVDADEDPDIVLEPWRALGRRWHTLPKGFAGDEAPTWPIDLVDRTLKLLSKVAGEQAFEFNEPDRVSVKLEPVASDEDDSSWAEVETKQSDCVRLKLIGPKAAIDIEQLLSLDILRDQTDTGTVDLSHADRVTITLNLKEIDDARSDRLKRFLQTHLDRTRSLT